MSRKISITETYKLEKSVKTKTKLKRKTFKHLSSSVQGQLANLELVPIDFGLL